MFWFYQAGAPSAPRNIGWWIFLPGLTLIGFGLLVVAVPEVLVLAIASLFFLAGFTALGWAWKLRRLAQMSGQRDHSENPRVIEIDRKDF